MMTKLMRICVVVGIVLAATGMAHGAVYFTDRSAFEAVAGGGLSFEGFEADFADGATIAFPDFTVSETGGVNILGQLRNHPGVVDAAITEGTGALGYDDNGVSVGTFFSFAGPVTAFGLDITANAGSTVAIGGSASDSVVLAANTPSFWGVIDFGGLTSIAFDASGGPNIGFDAALYGEAIPVPGAVLLGMLGLSVAGIKLRKSA